MKLVYIFKAKNEGKFKIKILTKKRVYRQSFVMPLQTDGDDAEVNDGVWFIIKEEKYN
jgi:hypothetical protein